VTIPSKAIEVVPSTSTTQASLLSSVAKTLGSMLICVVVYMYLWPWQIAVGFVMLIFFHEMGHVLAMKYYRLRASPPIFVPFLGAIIDLKEDPPNAKVEAIVGIGGPILGTLAALVCYAVWWQTQSPIFLALAFWGFLLNLFNMTPVPPLDGGRITAAISPWIWMIGFAVLLGFIVQGIAVKTVSPLLLVLAVYATPRVWRTLRGRERMGDYYNIPKSASRWIAITYLALGVVLVICFLQTRDLVNFGR